METEYSTKTDDEMDDINNEYTLKYGKYLFDDSLPWEERKLVNLVGDQTKDETQQEIKSVCDFILEFLFRSLKELSMIIFLAIYKLQDWGQHGEDRVTISFIRIILNIPNDTQVTWVDALEFDLLVDKYDRLMGFKSGAEYKAWCNSWSLNLLGRIYKISDIDEVNELFKLVGGMDDFFVWGTLNPYGIRVVFGIMEELPLDSNFKVYVMRKELIRSPQMVASVAAEVYEDFSIVRQAAFETIINNKYMDYFNQPLDRNIALLHDYDAIREGFKRLALFHYGISCKEDLKQQLGAFTKTQMVFTAIHEIGHHISYKDFLPEYFYYHHCLCNRMAVGSTLLEALADYAGEGSQKGPMLSFYELSKTNIKIATANLLVYLSDNWFPDSEEPDYYANHSDVLVGTALSFFLPDGTVDFERFGTQIGTLYKFFLARYNSLVDQLISVIKTAEYDFGIKKQNFFQLQERIVEMHQGTNAKPLEELQKTGTYWENLLEFLRQYSAEGWLKYQKILEDETRSVEKSLLDMITDNNGEKYGSLREFIIQKCRECKIIEKPLNADRQRKIRQMTQYEVIDHGKIKTRRKVK